MVHMTHLLTTTEYDVRMDLGLPLDNCHILDPGEYNPYETMRYLTVRAGQLRIEQEARSMAAFMASRAEVVCR